MGGHDPEGGSDLPCHADKSYVQRRAPTIREGRVPRIRGYMSHRINPSKPIYGTNVADATTCGWTSTATAGSDVRLGT